MDDPARRMLVLVCSAATTAVMDMATQMAKSTFFTIAKEPHMLEFSI